MAKLPPRLYLFNVTYGDHVLNSWDASKSPPIDLPTLHNTPLLAYTKVYSFRSLHTLSLTDEEFLEIANLEKGEYTVLSGRIANTMMRVR